MMKIPNALVRPVLSLISGLMLASAFPPYNFYPLLWVALVPLFFALEETSPRQAYCLGILAGTAGIMLAYPWIIHVSRIYMGFPVPANYLGWLVYAIVHAQVFGLAYYACRWLQQRTQLHPLFIYPVTFTAIWSLVPTIFFFNLANGVGEFSIALQPLEIFGTWGLDLIIVVCNVMIYSLLRQQYFNSKLALSVAGLVLIGWLITGAVLQKNWEKRIDSWETKRIGIVQPHRSASLGVLSPEKGFTKQYPLAMHLSHAIASENPDIIIWPEGNHYKYFEWKNIRDAFTDNIKKIGIPLIFHDYPYDLLDEKILYRNSSVALSEKGELLGRYDKRYIVPFGEYIPLLDYDSKLAEWLPLPPPVTPGDESVVFNISDMKITPLICYEVQFPDFVAESVGRQPKGKMLIVQSNDGWYGRSGQVYQHNSSTRLRAVEHRLPLVHVINNGPSTLVLPDGRFSFQAPFWGRGSWVVPMPYNADSGGTFYSRYPGLVLTIIRLSFLFLIFYALRDTLKATLAGIKARIGI